MLSFLEKNNLWKTEILQIYGLWYQEIDLWFTNHELKKEKTIKKMTPIMLYNSLYW